ncbi:hypothetical protein FG87_32985 [Nocardia vulneris]|uniref:Uncharacterized protein n=1 Tax=Nocardia vulneris TaxID=1141657 RepID=A0ABR4Z715_9NOCA|nr:hypothetical protein FG87_32985 [Nocardia vulneris]
MSGGNSGGPVTGTDTVPVPPGQSRAVPATIGKPSSNATVVGSKVAGAGGLGPTATATANATAVKIAAPKNPQREPGQELRPELGH